jgi:hypothetical protein
VKGRDEQAASKQTAETRAGSFQAWMFGASPAATSDGGLGPLEQPRRAADCASQYAVVGGCSIEEAAAKFGGYSFVPGSIEH